MTASAVNAQSSVLKNVSLKNTHVVTTPPPADKIYHLVSPQEARKNLEAIQQSGKLKAEPPGATQWNVETPASIACVYNLVDQNATQPPGCQPYNTPNNPVDGAGSIAIIGNAGHFLTARSDLSSFSNQYNLTPSDSSDSDPSNFQVVEVGDPWPYIFGQPPLPITDEGSLIETAMDIEWSHAMAPKATIFLVEPQGFDPVNLSQALEAAHYLVSTHGGGEVTNSHYINGS